MTDALLPDSDPRVSFDPDAVVVSETVLIEAPAELVWQVLVDFAAYPDWNPFCVEASAELELGAPVTMKLKSYLEPDTYFDNVEYISALDAPRLIAWSAPYIEAWPYPARRDQIIEALGPERCQYHSTDAFLGPHGIHVMRFAGPWVKRAFNDTAWALKARAESLVISQA